jgi:pyruvate,water dikinase
MTIAEPTAAAVGFDPPGGGWWELETLHIRGAVPVVFQELFPAAIADAFGAVARRYGLPVSHPDVHFVAHHYYARMVPVGAPEPRPGKVTKAPPDLAIRMLARVHPELRRRAAAARRALAERYWIADRERWERDLRPAQRATNVALQAEDPDGLDGPELAGHLVRCIENAARGTRTHFELLGAYNVPVGRFAAACDDWGIGAAAGLGLLGGYSPASAAGGAELRQLAAVVAASGARPATLDELRAVPGAEAALDALLAEHGWRVLTDYTPRGTTLAEEPAILLRLVAAATTTAGAAGSPDADAVRTLVPAVERGRFDELLAEARAASDVRDDNVGLTFMWPMGLVRRALLAAGRRLSEVAKRPEDALWLGRDELVALLHGTGGPGPEDLAERVAEVRAAEAQGAPEGIGWSEGGAPDFSLFPPAVAEITRAFLLAFDLETAATPAGVGIGEATYLGRAVVAPAAEEALARIEPGDVLITTLTTPAYNVVLPVCGAVVTEQGGLLSHTALVARELGIPAVCGVSGICSAVPDGAIVEVDARAGTVRVVA